MDQIQINWADRVDSDNGPARCTAGRSVLPVLVYIPERGHAHAAVVAALLLIYLALLLGSLRNTSVTTDEFGHLPLAYGYLSTGNSRWLLMNPPSQRILAALPLLFSKDVVLSADLPGNDLDFWRVGMSFMKDNLKNYHSLYARARAVVALLACITGLVIYGLARLLGGPRAGAVALMLFAFSPDFLAHGGLVTTDLSAALASTAVVLSALHYCRRRTVPGLVLVCICVSLLFLSKFNALYFLLLVPAILFAGHAMSPLNKEGIGKRPRPVRVLFELAVIGFSSWLLLCAAYRFQGLFIPLGEYLIKSAWLSTLQPALPRLPVPLPAAYLHALDLQLYDASRPWLSYLLGQVSLEKSVWYYPVCLLFKSPLAMLTMMVLSLFITRRESTRWSLIPGLLYFLVFLVVPGKHYGFRLMLPAIGFFIVFIAVAFTCPRPIIARGRRGLFFASLFIVLVGWYSVATLVSYPHYISYFNELAGGPGYPHRGHEILADSNLDWGQDWIRLAQWQQETHIHNIRLAYYGVLAPRIYGVRYERANCALDPGYLAVSANLVLGIDPFRTSSRCFSKLKAMTPVARPGPSIWVYKIP
jgi:hypothetical protein